MGKTRQPPSRAPMGKRGPEVDPAVAKIFAQRGMIARIAKETGRSHQAVSQWKRIPAELVLVVSGIAGISPYSLRPDLYPRGLIQKKSKG